MCVCVCIYIYIYIYVGFCLVLYLTNKATCLFCLAVYVFGILCQEIAMYIVLASEKRFCYICRTNYLLLKTLYAFAVAHLK